MIELYTGIPGSGMTYPKEGRNAPQWRAIAYFLCGLKVAAPHRGDVDESGQAQRRTLPARAPR